MFHRILYDKALIGEIFHRINQTQLITVRIGSLSMFEGGQVHTVDSNWFKVFAVRLDFAVVLARLVTPYDVPSSNGVSNLGFIACQNYTPLGVNLMDLESQNHFVTAGIQGDFNWVGHRLRGMRMKVIDSAQCGRIYNDVSSAAAVVDFNPPILTCYTLWWCEKVACPSEQTPEQYDNGAGVYYMGTNILTGIIQAHHRYRVPWKLPMASVLGGLQAQIVAEIRANQVDYYQENYPEFNEDSGVN